MAAYRVTVLSGLEEIARQDIGRRLPGVVIRGADAPPPRGHLCFDYDGPPAEVLRLRSVENVFAAVAEFEGVPADATGPEFIRAQVAAVDLGEAVRVHAALHGERAAPSFRCTSKRAGPHPFGSMDIMAAAGAAIIDRYGWKVDLEHFDYDVHVDLAEDRCTVGLRLTPVTLGRRTRVVHSAASLNPPLGYCLCLLTEPCEGEVFLDPMCGAGTILIERASLGPVTLLAGDLYARAVGLARRNFEECDLPVALHRWDARQLPLRPESVDKICCNLPWGRRAGSHTINRHLYPGFIREVAQVLRVGGLAVFLTLEKSLMTRLVERHGWLRMEASLLIRVGGLDPWIFVVRKYRSHEPPE